MCASLCTLFDGTTSVAVCCPANEFSGARFHSIQLLRAFCGRVAASADSSSLICRVLRSLGKYTFSTLIPSRSRSLVFKGRRLLAVSRAQPKQGNLTNILIPALLITFIMTSTVDLACFTWKIVSQKETIMVGYNGNVVSTVTFTTSSRRGRRPFVCTAAVKAMSKNKMG